MKRRGAAAPPPAHGKRPAPPAPRAAPATLLRALPALAIPGAALALLFACRGARPGTPVSDDYAFLATLRFDHPLDIFGSMGGAYYWRPLSRQLYFSLAGPWLLSAPGWDAALHFALLVATAGLLVSAARGRMGTAAAAALAAFLLLAEPARVLLVWPSGGQHLLALLGVAAAAHEALARRWATAGIAALGAVLSHDQAWLVLPALPAIAALAHRNRRDTLTALAIAAAIAIAWAAGYGVARAHGVAFPPAAAGGFPWHALPAVLRRAVVAQLDLEDLPGTLAWALAGANALLLILALARARHAEVRARLRAALPAVAGGLAWFVAAVAPLALLLPDWNGWRTVVPGLGLGLALVALLAAAAPGLALAFVVLRLVSLLAAPVAGPGVSPEPPPSASNQSFLRHVRVTRATEAARTALARHDPRLPRGAVVRYASMIRLADFGFSESNAVRVWYGDSTLTWTGLGGEPGLMKRDGPIVYFDTDARDLAVVAEPAALDDYRAGRRACTANQWGRADSLLSAAFAAQPTFSRTFGGELARVHVLALLALEQYERADSLNQLELQWSGENPAYYCAVARMAAHAGDMRTAGAAITRALQLDPKDAQTLEVAKALRYHMIVK